MSALRPVEEAGELPKSDGWHDGGMGWWSDDGEDQEAGWRTMQRFQGRRKTRGACVGTVT